MTDIKKRSKSVRADVLLVERGLVDTRTKAQARILAGQVYSGEVRIDKSGTPLAYDAVLTVRESERYVSRGGYKLEGALDTLQINVQDWVCADVGASTGGFSDCLLQRGASLLFAIDVGHGLLAHKIATDPRVVVMDRTNARFLTADQFTKPLDLAVVDASFIGLALLAPALSRVLASGRHVLAMIKPQFEVGRDAAREARGVITDPALRAEAIDRAVADLVAAGFECLARTDSILAGPKGNVEHFVYAVRTDTPASA
jgi:23S rRNA (cytidine1920-2'-O)/16S rRNA (cytidine1409-2'-O)-methyltransferase